MIEAASAEIPAVLGVHDGEFIGAFLIPGFTARFYPVATFFHGIIGMTPRHPNPSFGDGLA
jgi:hypothetical protein